jgi:hypothetical protein
MRHNIKPDSQYKRNITPQMAKAMLKKKGVEITEEEAEKVLDLMYFLSELIIKHGEIDGKKLSK